jgi:hypothetical protein|tara:strand:- start:6572 stop:8491 length:1920 start_codon:yes stop_codon:yes gene_type:complete
MEGKVTTFFLAVVFLMSMVSALDSGFGYDNPTLPQLTQDLFGNNPSSFYMPNNKSVFGSFDFNGGWLNDGLSIIDGDIYAQIGYFYNITSLNITKQNITILENFIVEGNVGIGTASPAKLLHLAAAEPYIRFDGTHADGDYQIGTGDGNLYFTDTSTGLSTITIDDDKVGIGTASPQNTLNVVGEGNFTGVVYRNNQLLIDWNQVMNGTLADNTTMGNYVVAKNNSLGTYVRAQDIIFNTTMGTYVVAKNDSMGLYVQAKNNSLATWADNKFLLNTGDTATGTYDFNGGWQSNGLTISDGDIYAQTGFFYNITGLNVNTLDVNGSLLPQEGWDDTFDLGNQTLRWRDVWLSGEVHSNGSENNWFLGNVGIGTTSPDAHVNLHITDTDYAFLALEATNAGGRQYELFSYATDESFHLYDRTATAYRLTVDETGKVGIGTTSPAAKLHTYNSGTYEALRMDGGTFAGSTVTAAFRNGNNAYQSVMGSYYGNWWLEVGTVASQVRAITVLGHGNPGFVGIGTTSPETTAHIATTTGALISDYGSAGGRGSMLYFGSYDQYHNFYIGNDGTNYFSIGQAGTDDTPIGNTKNPKFTVTGGGYVGIGTTSPSHNLNVVGNVNITGNLLVGGCIQYNYNTTLGACL